MKILRECEAREKLVISSPSVLHGRNGMEETEERDPSDSLSSVELRATALWVGLQSLQVPSQQYQQQQQQQTTVTDKARPVSLSKK